MKRLIFWLCIILPPIVCGCPKAFAQGVGVRWDSYSWTTTTVNSAGTAVAPIPGAVVALCNYPANAVPCTNYATSYTSAALATACPTATPVVLQGTTTCVSGSDPLGNFGFWLPGFTNYAYTLTVNGVSAGPFSFTSPTAQSINDASFATFSAACAAAVSANATLLVSRAWTSLPTQTCAANLQFQIGGMIQPANGQTFTPTGTWSAPLFKVIDLSLGGMVAAIKTDRVPLAWFGAWADMTHDDSTAIGYAFSWLNANPGRTLYVNPGGNKLVASGAAWNSDNMLRLKGESYNTSYFIYTGSSIIDSTLHVDRTSGGYWSSVDIRDLGIAANSNASYAFHAHQVGSGSTMDNVAFQGGSISSFQAEFWNGQNDLRNLTVNQGQFAPLGDSGCVRGLTFTSGVDAPSSTQFPSSQFTLTAPTVMYCTGTGLMMDQVTGITVNGGQISSNNQQLYQGCSLSSCNGVGSTFNNVLLEDTTGSIANVVNGDSNTFIGPLIGGLSSSGTMNIFGRHNTFVGGQGIFNVESGAINTLFLNSLIVSGSTDAGTNTLGAGNRTTSSTPIWNNWTIPDIWHGVSYQNSWQDTSTYLAAGYTIDLNGFVHLRGYAKGGTPGTSYPMFTLPVGYRPSATWAGAGDCETSSVVTSCEVYVYSNGNVTVNGTSVAYVGLGSVVFDTR
jgi:hypothetical protein